MLNLFRKKERKVPTFVDLENSTIKDKYFIRLAQWDWLNNQMIQIVDNNAPRLITLDPWPQLIFLNATGEKTIAAFVNKMVNMYGAKEKIPENLDTNILEMVATLLNEKLIALVDTAGTLPYYLDLPQCELDQEKARKLMEADGFLKMGHLP